MKTARCLYVLTIAFCALLFASLAREAYSQPDEKQPADVARKKVIVRGLFDFSSAEAQRLGVFLKLKETVKLPISVDVSLPHDELRKRDVQVFWTDPLEKVTSVLSETKTLTYIFSDAEGGAVRAQLMLQDFNPSSPRAPLENAKKALRASLDSPLSLVTIGPDPKNIRVTRIREQPSLEDEWGKAIKGFTAWRSVAYKDTAVIVLPPASADEQREQKVTAYLRSLETDLGALSDKNAAEAAKVAQKIGKDTTTMFQGVYRENLTNDRLAAYAKYWTYGLGDRFAENPAGQKAAMKVFAAGLAESIKGRKSNKCSVTVVASNGEGAVIKYAKPPDDRKGIFKEMPRPTMVTHDVERAQYIFHSYRNGRETGKTEAIVCTGETQPVVVSE